MRRWQVGGALIRHGDGLVLVGNRRRDQTLEWTPPGGVIDPGETLLDGLRREVLEETGLIVSSWSGLRYTVIVDAPDMDWRLRVEAWEVGEVVGEVKLADPDGIVEEVRHASHSEASVLLQASPPWVHTPVGAWLEGGVETRFRFVLHGAERGSGRVERVE